MSETVELKACEIVGTGEGPRLLITGGVHGDEFEPMAAIRRLMRQVDAEQLRGRLTLIPVVNQAAFIRGHRTADDELDLARTCPGLVEGSVTERTAFALSQRIRSADCYIDLHTGGTTLSVWPMAGYMLNVSPDVLETQRRMAKAFNLPMVWGTLGLEGRSLSIARDAKIPAIYAEYLGSGRCDAAGVQAYVSGCLNVIRELDMIDREMPTSMVEHVVEDDRPGAGHMQVQNQSPLSGFFEPAVKLGETIRKGEAIGTVCDALGEKEVTIRSQQSGIVLVLRTFSRVLEGETVGVILETEGN